MAETRNPAGPGRPGTPPPGTPPLASQAPGTNLDALFASARASADRPAPAALMARVMADAERWLPAPAPPAPRPGMLAALLAAFGGWPALGGLATAGVAGFWIGLAPPAAVGDLGLWSAGDSDSAALLPEDYLDVTAEG